MFNPQRLSLARKRRRLSSKGLAELIGMSPVTVTRLEKANNEPEPETVDLIARKLGFPREFFFGDDIDDLDKNSASFRSLTSMTARERDAALASGSLAYLFSDYISTKFNLPEPQLIDLSHERDPAAAARTLRQVWALGEQPISSMIKLLEAKGVRVFSLAENTKNVDAFSCWRNDVPYVFLNTFKSAERSRLDAAHELAHLVLHKHGGPRQGRDAEMEANNFASSFLMPTADVRSRIPFVRRLDDLVAAKRRWGVSTSALAYRLHKLGILSDWQYRTFCIQINQRGYRTDEPNGLPREQSVIWKKVFTELWGERISKNQIAADLQLPTQELENLVFGLTGNTEPPERIGRPSLKAV
ncbi:helix-turn-helix domain-containing protein [Bradyrhizobium icense]|uniref:XRE family transcriptional regulator n=1 Tax=Bradyrhizobium icense TaxID=1274631 RepID=A0A1B1UAI5_9BRAD|nr:XRE family transcriptional regulator [Bradyrhizobium icense]ANV99761.1 XRE family transcriptional regulator [Bradyrhizobium icense]